MARASLEELRLDYEDFLRQRKLPIWDYADLRRQDLIRKRLSTADQFALWARDQQSSCVEEAAANGVLVLLSIACMLLERQLAAQAEAFKNEGGFTERLYRTRIENRK